MSQYIYLRLRNIQNGLPSRLKFSTQRVEIISSDILFKSFWISTTLAILLTLPSLVLFFGLYWHSNDLILSAILGFALHFITLGFSAKVSECISSFVDN